MIKLLNSFNNFSFRVIKRLVPSFSGMLRVKAGRPLINHILRGVILVKGSITNSLVKVIVVYVRRLFVLNKSNGPSFVAKYLKSSVSLLMQALAGAQHLTTQELGVAVARTNRGLPRLIPKLHRKRIREGDVTCIRLWLTLFSIYRVIDFTGRLKISTIITPSKARINKDELVKATLSLNDQFKGNIAKGVSEMALRPFWISSSSPNSFTVPVAKRNIGSYSTSIYSIIGALRAFVKTKQVKLLMHFTLRAPSYFKGDSSPAMHPMLKLLTMGGPHASLSFPPTVLYRIRDDFNFYSNYMSDEVFLRDSFLGKLAFKVEAAGKVRVFAMVDCFTQWLLNPLHKSIFNFLRKIPEDATHDQGETLRLFVDRLRRNSISKVYSFDLTAATDRIPVSAQALILDSILGSKKQFGDTWAKFLTDRWYQLSTPVWDPKAITCAALGIDPEKEKGNPYLSLKLSKPDLNGKKHMYVDAVRYATGQPMGALSSWAMLALTHHIMVRIAALRCGIREFSLYLVLGDDIVIADEQVAKSYLRLCEEWDIGINLSKSVLSDNGSLEFAKRFVYKYQDVTGLSFREVSVARYDIRGLLQLLSRVKSFRNIRISEALSFLGHGYRALSRMNTRYNKMGQGLRRALLLVSYPSLVFSKLTSYKDWITSSAFNKPGKLAILTEQLEYLKDLGRKTADSVEQSYLPRNPSEFKSFFFSMFTPHSRFDPAYTDVFEDPILKSYWDDLGEDLQASLMPMYEEIHNSWDQTTVTAKDTFDFESEMGFDELWESLLTLEDISSEASIVSEFRPIDDIITLGSSLLLKRATLIRNKFRSLADEHKVKINQPLPRYPQPPIQLSMQEKFRILMEKRRLKGLPTVTDYAE